MSQPPAIQGEATLAYLVRRQVAVGVEYRTRSRNLSVDDESAAWDAFVAWAPNRHVSIVAAYANLGSIAAPLTGESKDQAGASWSSSCSRTSASTSCSRRPI